MWLKILNCSWTYKDLLQSNKIKKEKEKKKPLAKTPEILIR